MSSFKLGDKMPNFSLPTIQGDHIDFDKHLEEHQSWHLIVFFRGSWCPVCVEELKELEQQQSYFQDKDIHLMTISTDNPDDLKEFADKEGLSFPIMSDQDLTSLKAYEVHYHGEDAPYEDHGVHGEPAYFLLNEKGQVLYQQRQTSPFGRPHANELRKIIQYIRKNLKGQYKSVK
ncbi:peroxiredoxin family protein [Bacillus pumilus]|uniref:peroxiredoxin family protein n=1 Tax=Bacillus TaxID=1386 RepID=UPI000D03D17D|nr:MULTISPECIES: peroxiredoxin family protein [Bacillus]MDF2004410.1 peroxiredoxin family protein [Bacillus pumilus]MDF2025453.1 peroxiredoxin family protein [Bacillus pumilus]MDF2029291.1 peroxiredoxin family protein [Bacillus pumilus]MDF2090338.1 peroxiredoxin family protein [Bacillus pumilus]PRS55447.1 peroxiredoxin [Bacillus sp. MZGC1]